MNALLSESPTLNNLSAGPAESQLDGIEFALLEARNRILGALDRELAEVRARKSGTVPDSTHQFRFYESDLPANVVPLSRDFFAVTEQLPAEAQIDPSLERATIEDLNAALEAAFSHMTV